MHLSGSGHDVVLYSRGNIKATNQQQGCCRTSRSAGTARQLPASRRRVLFSSQAGGRAHLSELLIAGPHIAPPHRHVHACNGGEYRYLANAARLHTSFATQQKGPSNGNASRQHQPST